MSGSPYARVANEKGICPFNIKALNRLATHKIDRLLIDNHGVIDSARSAVKLLFTLVNQRVEKLRISRTLVNLAQDTRDSGGNRCPAAEAAGNWDLRGNVDFN